MLHLALRPYLGDFAPTGDVPQDAVRLLTARGRVDTAEHCRRVAVKARRLARRWGVDEARAEVAGWLHDISAVVPGAERLSVAEALGLEVLAEERAAPVLVHQKLSAVIAREGFDIIDEGVLSAIGCHTTLKGGSSPLDQVVFVADKLAWDQPGEPPYLAEMSAAVERSLAEAAFCYLEYLWQRREALPAFHPWAVGAYRELREP